MLTFVIPLQSARVSKSWERVSQVLQRSLRSICNQTCSQFQVIVVCHEQPLMRFSHPRIHYIQAHFPPPDLSTIPPYEALEQKRTDKGRKMLLGLVAAREFNTSHTLLMDADDCVSRYLAEFVSQHSTYNGWFINKGYRYEEGSNTVYFKRDFYRMCGTCNILKYDLNNIPENPAYNRGYGYYRYYIDHWKVRQVLQRQGFPLAPLPFPGAVYMTATGENLYYSPSRLYQGILKLANQRLLSRAVCEEFGIYPLAVVC